MYLVGIDGGATKTSCMIGDNKGNILAEGSAGPSNYQIVGEEKAGAQIEGALKEALNKLGASINEIDCAVLGLAGADMEEDFVILNRLCLEIFKEVPFRIVNDCWLGLRACIDENWGVITVCGTGTNSAGRTKDGKEATLRSMSYMTGNWGGGYDLLVEALHYAFRSEEGTGTKTQLEEGLLKLMGLHGMDELAKIIRLEKYDYKKIYQVPIMVFELASKGDKVCQDILIDMGHQMGLYAGGIIKRLGLENENFTVALAGSIFKGKNPLLVDEYTTTVHRTAPYASIKISDREPVVGAYLLALDSVNKKHA